jgi:hypothetical protein
MFWTAAAGLFCAILLLYAASGRFDLLACARAHPDSPDRYRAGQLSIGEHLSRALARADEAGLNEGLPRHFGPFRNAPLEVAQTNDLMLDPKDIRETTLRQAARERHLAALELRLASTRAVMSSAGLDSLVALARRLSRAGARATPEPLAIAMRSRGRNEVNETEALNRLDDLFLYILNYLSTTGETSTKRRTR